jgi:uncharacterized protein
MEPMTDKVAYFEIDDFPGTGQLEDLVPAITADIAPFWDALRSGFLALQRCSSCGELRYPVAPACPYCLSDEAEWAKVAGNGSIFSWIRYHKCYLSQFESLMPYAVVTVQLDAGPRIFGRWASDAPPEIEAPVEMFGERWADGHVSHAFRLNRCESASS